MCVNYFAECSRNCAQVVTYKLLSEIKFKYRLLAFLMFSPTYLRKSLYFAGVLETLSIYAIVCVTVASDATCSSDCCLVTVHSKLLQLDCASECSLRTNWQWLTFELTRLFAGVYWPLNWPGLFVGVRWPLVMTEIVTLVASRHIDGCGNMFTYLL